MPSALSATRAFFPLDEELQLLPGQLTPRLQEMVVRLATWMPFARAAQEVEWFTQVTVSEALARRLTEKAGATQVALQTAEVEHLERTTPEPPAGPAVQMVSVDGAMVPLLHGEWGEVKTLVIGTVQPPVLEQGEKVVHTTELSYFSRLTDAETFGRLATVETQRRGVERAGCVCAVTDGAVWEQGFVDLHCPTAVRILDFSHAMEHLALAGQVVHGEATPAFYRWLQDTAHELKHGSPDAVLAQLETLYTEQVQTGNSRATVILEQHAYLAKRRAHIAYAEFQAQGYPIGSGAVESGNKLVVEVRLKGAGMHWERTHVNPLLALRNLVCNDRWDEAWSSIDQSQRDTARRVRRARQQEHRLKQSAVCALPQRSGEEKPSLRQRTDTARAVPQPAPQRNPTGRAHRPADDHPWRHSPIGRARFKPYRKPSAKL